MNDIPIDHPRLKSLLIREKLIEGQKKGFLAPAAAIAHGRGEAFDYILGEKTIQSAKEAIDISARLLLTAKRPIVSVNGNTAVLVRDELLQLAKILNCPIEINLFYRTSERMNKLLIHFENTLGVQILGKDPDAIIPNLSSNRAKCCSNGILSADVVFVPLEDGDRCEALIKMGKKVIVVDLNPFSRTAVKASLTIVDNISRCSILLIESIKKLKSSKGENIELINYNNKDFLNQSVEEMKKRIEEFKRKLIT